MYIPEQEINWGIKKDRYSFGMVGIILGIERHSVLGMQIGYLEEIEKVLSLSFFLLPAGSVPINSDWKLSLDPDLKSPIASDSFG